MHAPAQIRPRRDRDPSLPQRSALHYHAGHGTPQGCRRCTDAAGGNRMPAHDASAGFERLWPTVILKRTIPGHDAPDRALLALIQRLEREQPDLTTAYRGQDLLAVPDPAAGWLAGCINVSVRDYFAHLGMDYDIRWTLHAWPNINRFGDYHDAHNHPRSYLSGTYYVQVPARMEPRHGRADVRPGCISLYDPRPMVNMTAIKGDPYVNPEYTVTPTAGMILMWPAFLNHFVHPNLSREPRVSVSFNVMLEWSDDYLPRQ
jgi:uncharacterized protein (TIGR02466 family)